MKYLRVLFGLILPLSFAQAQPRQYQAHSFHQQTLAIQTAAGEYRIRPFSDKITEVTFLPSGVAPVDTSHSVVMQPSPLKSRPDLNKLQWKFKTHTLQFNRQNLRIEFATKQAPIAQEILDGKFSDTLHQIKFALQSGEAIWGLGERALPLNRRGYRLELYNRPHYGYEREAPLMGYNIPMIVSSRGYAILVDNASRGWADVGKTDPNVLSFEFTGGSLRYYFITGDNLEDILVQYTLLTGRQPLPPRWALGNFASRYGYRTERETRDIITKFKEADLPVEAVILDHYWYGEGIPKKSVQMGDLDWYRPAFPTGEQMMRDLAAQHTRTILITQPFVLTASKHFAEAAAQDLFVKDKSGKPYIIKDFFYFGETALLDIFKPATQRWFWSKYKRLIDQGMGGVWGDLGEPEVHLADMQHTAGKAEELHNVYGHYWAKMIAEGYARDYPTVRPFILMRAGAAGSQRFGLIPWSGDVSRSWGGLQAQPGIALSMNLNGVSYMHSDLGGFAGGERNPELYLRWLQYGVFQPIFRPHSQDHVPSEMVLYPDSVQNIAKNILALRYALLPYNYTLAWQNSTQGKPLMKPLFAEEPQNATLYNTDDTYLWGDNILVAPILTAGLAKRKVYLPAKSSWYEVNNKGKGTLHQGGQTIDVNTQPEMIPFFVRGGSFVVLSEDERTPISKYQGKNLRVLYICEGGDSKSNYTMYDDDGSTPQAYQRGEYELLHCKSAQKGKKITLKFARERFKSYTTQPAERNISLRIANMKAAPKLVKVNGKPTTDYSYSPEAEFLVITLKCIDNLAVEIE